MLLAGLECHAKCGIAIHVNGSTNDASGHKALVGVLASEECGMRTAVAHRNSESLRRTKDDVGTPASGRRQQGQRQNVGSYGQAHLVAGTGSAELDVIAYGTAGSRVLHKGSKKLVGGLKAHRIAKHQLYADGLSAGLKQGLGLGVDVVVDKKLKGIALLLIAAAGGKQKGHGLSSSCRLVEQRSVGNFHPGQVNHHRLVVEQRLEAALGNLSLVGRVGGVPSWVFENVALNYCRQCCRVVSLTDVAGKNLVLLRNFVDVAQVLLLADGRRDVERTRTADARRNRFVDQLIEAVRPNRLKHLLLFFRLWTDVTAFETSLHGGRNLGL